MTVEHHEFPGRPSTVPRSRRGAGSQPPNRFAATYRAALPALDEPEPEPLPRTQFIPDHSVSVITYNDSPDLGFAASLNPYRGCEHGCSYCYARPTHEYLGFDAGLGFEQRILVKPEAPALLRRALASPRWRPEPVTFSGNTDCYQPIERYLELTRACLGVLAEFRNPVAVITKSALVTRDIDLLRELSAVSAAHVWLSVTTLDPDLARRMEPRAPEPRRRLKAIEALVAAGVPTGCVVGPVIPGLNDAEMPAILAAARDAGCRSASWVLLRLPRPVDTIFSAWLADQMPGRRARVLGRIRETRGGALNDPRFGSRKRGEGAYAAHLAALFAVAARRYGLERPLPALSSAAFRRAAGETAQLALWA